MKPEISIIVPIYNVEKYLPRCIESILAQTFTNFELILVNDGSEDDSGEVCDRYAKEDKRIKVIHKKNGGVSSARNAGLKNSIGNYIGFVDPDDYIKKDMYEKMYNLCIKKDSKIAICKFAREVDGKIINADNNETEIIRELNNEEAMNELFKGVLYRFSLCNKLFNKKCFQGITFPEGRIHEDLSTTYKLFANSNRSIYTTYQGYIYVKREDSILTKQYNEKRLQSFIGWDEILEFMNKRYEKVNEQVVATFTYWCVDNIFYIMNQVKDKDELIKYLNFIRSYTLKYKKLINSNDLLSEKYKIRVRLLNLSSKIIIIEKKLKKKLGSNI